MAGGHWRAQSQGPKAWAPGYYYRSWTIDTRLPVGRSPPRSGLRCSNVDAGLIAQAVRPSLPRGPRACHVVAETRRVGVYGGPTACPRLVFATASIPLLSRSTLSDLPLR
ncbi:hypothetical protein C8Q78DRAFT_806438 [Trametes maxima]|nr:hypothetical protein C8Q78DRAFT_806438 [Trametes maxima]